MKNGLYSNYDELVVKCLPEYYFLLNVAARAISKVCTIVDLGCGTGNLPKIIFQAMPKVAIRGIDNSANLLAIASEKNIQYCFQPILSDIMHFDLGREAEECIISSFTIHHFDDSEKRVLFERIFQALRPGGIFINLDMVKPRNYRQTVSNFLAKMKESGLSAKFIEAERQEMIERDRPVSLSVQKKWLEQIGFQFELLHDSLFAIYSCQKPIS